MPMFNLNTNVDFTITNVYINGEFEENNNIVSQNGSIIDISAASAILTLDADDSGFAPTLTGNYKYGYGGAINLVDGTLNIYDGVIANNRVLGTTHNLCAGGGVYYNNGTQEAPTSATINIKGAPYIKDNTQYIIGSEENKPVASNLWAGSRLFNVIGQLNNAAAQDTRYANIGVYSEKSSGEQFASNTMSGTTLADPACFSNDKDYSLVAFADKSDKSIVYWRGVVCRIDNTFYTTLREAVNAVGSGQTATIFMVVPQHEISAENGNGEGPITFSSNSKVTIATDTSYVPETQYPLGSTLSREMNDDATYKNTQDLLEVGNNAQLSLGSIIVDGKGYKDDSGNPVSQAGSLFKVDSGSKLTLLAPQASLFGLLGNSHIGGNPALINNFSSNSGSAISAQGAVEFAGGNIYGNYCSANGGAVSLGSGSEIAMSNGSIHDNTAGQNGGGLAMDSSAKFTMTGGNFHKNTAANEGGAVYVAPGNSANEDQGFYLQGGQIGTTQYNGNSAAIGGGVSVHGQMHFSSGSVSYNSAVKAASVENSGMAGGIELAGSMDFADAATVTHNDAATKAGGIHVSGAGILNISVTAGVNASPSVLENTQGSPKIASNLYTVDASAQNIKVDSELSGTEGSIGVYSKEKESLQEQDQFATNATAEAQSEASARVFHNDLAPNFYGMQHPDTETQLSKLVWGAFTIVTFDANGGEITAPDSVVANYGNVLPGPQKMSGTLTGYVLDGFADANGTKFYNADGTATTATWDKWTEKETLYAIWTPAVFKITLTVGEGETQGTAEIYEKYTGGYYSDK